MCANGVFSYSVYVAAIDLIDFNNILFRMTMKLKQLNTHSSVVSDKIHIKLVFGTYLYTNSAEEHSPLTTIGEYITCVLHSTNTLCSPHKLLEKHSGLNVFSIEVEDPHVLVHVGPDPQSHYPTFAAANPCKDKKCVPSTNHIIPRVQF